MRINHNLTAMNAHRQLSINNDNISKNVAKLSSGYRINSAADDAAGLSISEKMRAQIKGIEQATRNSQDGISLVQTAEGSLQTVNDMLSRIKELATQSANGTYNTADRSNLDLEVRQLSAELNNIKGKTTFNGINVLNSTTSISIQIGEQASQTLSLSGNTFNLSGVAAAVSGMNLKNAGSAKAVMSNVATQINNVNSMRSYLGANQNRLENTINNLNTVDENLSASESRIRDVDMAKEMMSFTKNNILSQAAQAMLAQANQLPQGVLQLLK